MRQQTAQPGEARADVSKEELYFTWLKSLSKLIRIKAGWVLQAAPLLEGLEERLNTLPAGEERQTVTADLEGRYTALARLWLDGLQPFLDQEPEAE